MTDDEIVEMVSELIKEIDYDIWKDMNEPEDPEFADEQMNELVLIVRKHLK